jgi:hypothetical protein
MDLVLTPYCKQGVTEMLIPSDMGMPTRAHGIGTPGIYSG